ncbi:hypothetical protein SKAU_G00341800 [Synaphobranchus kaupii]|uniref:Uncharacterized protein n=1 Tax=Synaphobranchus kaupii TaxID=118154 RepID=A0A9Q1EN88_SYNKA|nr:hypothetical protein SKAU_G00341800 [Synaphobranchus kaupii]
MGFHEVFRNCDRSLSVFSPFRRVERRRLSQLPTGLSGTERLSCLSVWRTQPQSRFGRRETRSRRADDVPPSRVQGNLTSCSPGVRGCGHGVIAVTSPRIRRRVRAYRGVACNSSSESTRRARSLGASLGQRRHRRDPAAAEEEEGGAFCCLPVVMVHTPPTPGPRLRCLARRSWSASAEVARQTGVEGNPLPTRHATAA